MFKKGDIVRFRKNRLDKNAKLYGRGKWVMLVKEVMEYPGPIVILETLELTCGQEGSVAARDVVKIC